MLSEAAEFRKNVGRISFKKGGKDGVRLEENIVVTKDGYDLLTKWPVDEITECPI